MTTTNNNLDQRPWEAITEQRRRLLAEADGLLANRSEDLAGEELTRFEAIGTELEDLARREAALNRMAQAVGSGGLVRGTDDYGLDGGPTFNVNRRTSAQNPWQALERSNALSREDWTAVARDCIERDAIAPDDGRERATRLVERSGAIGEYVTLVSAPAYARAWHKIVADPNLGPHRLTPEEAEAVHRVHTRAASLTDAAGGYAVPFALDPTIITTNAGAANPLRRISRAVAVTSDVWNGVSSAGVTASWDPEASEVSDDAPTLAQPTIPVHKAQAFVPFSIEVGMDWPGFADEMGRLLMDARDRLEATAFTVGTGTNQPTGIVTALTGTASEVATATPDTFVVGDVYTVSDALPARYWANASWIGHRAIYSLIRRFDTQGGANLWTHLDAETPPLLLGKRVYENSDMDSTLTPTAANYILLVGDFSRFVIVDRVGMQVETVPTLFGANRRPTGQRGIHAWWRTGSDSVDDGAFRMLNA